MAEPIKIFSGSSGINTKTDPARLRFNPETGISELAACINIDISDDGRISRRTGYTATDRTESWHSLFSCGSYALGVTGNALAVIEADLSRTNLRNVATGAKMSYVRTSDGESDITFYANGYENGLIKNKTSYSWPLITPVGATTKKEFYPAPVGHLLEIYNSRMFISEDNILWYSEPNTYHAYRLGANYFGFSSRIKMLQAVDNGLWISDSESLFFLGGNIAPVLQEMPKQTKKADYCAVEGTFQKIPASRIGSGEMQGVAIIFMTTGGIVVGGPNGELMNLSERKLDIPSSLTGASLYKDGHCIFTLD